MKQLLICSVLAILVNTPTKAQTRLVLYEEFTCEACVPCSVINPTFDALMASGTNPEHVCMIKFMSDIPSTGHFFDLTATMDLARMNYYSVNFAPYGRLDGAIADLSAPSPADPYFLTQADIDAETAIPSPFKMSVSSSLNTAYDSVTINVKVKAVTDFAPEGALLRLRTARCKSVYFSSSSVLINGEGRMLNVVRDMYPDTTGFLISSVWASGDSQTYTFSGPINPEDDGGWFDGKVYTDSFAVAWIQNDSNKTVLQAAKEGLVVPPVTTGISTAGGAANSFSMWPNPAATTTTIEMDALYTGNAAITISDITGQVISTVDRYLSAGRNRITIDIAAYPPGLYYVMVYSEGGMSSRKLSIIR